MKTKHVELSAHEDLFRRACRIVDLKEEYPGYTGRERWLIVTEADETEVRLRWPEEADRYSPYLLMTERMAAPILDSARLERAWARRRKDHFEYSLDLMEQEEIARASAAYWQPSAEETYLTDQMGETMRRIADSLPEPRRRRFCKRFWEGKTLAEISAEEGVSISSVAESVRLARQSFIGSFRKAWPAGFTGCAEKEGGRRGN